MNIKKEQRGAICILTIDRPKVYNVFDQETCSQLSTYLDESNADRSVRVTIITGAGDKAFSAGFDLSYAQNNPEVYDNPLFGSEIVRRSAGEKPVIAAVNGFAIGLGFELALSCDLIIASDKATFTLPEPAIGLAAMGGGVARLSRDLGQKRTLGIVLTGRRVSAQEALSLGLVSEVTTEYVVDVALVWAEQIAVGAPLSIAATQEMASNSVEMSLAQSLDPHNYPACLTLLKSDDVHEGRKAFLEKRKPKWTGQ